jgi:hypothetical protein
MSSRSSATSICASTLAGSDEHGWYLGALNGVDNCVVRTRVTSKPWFGPKKYFGWGWRIESWEGRLTTAILLLLILMSTIFWSGSRVVPVVVLLLAYGVVVLLTGDPPGGPSGTRD